MIIVSTDGSCLRNPGGAIGWAWVNHKGSSRSGGVVSGTNQIAELRAVLEAILAHPGTEPLLIESDSLYAIKCASEWISGWRLNGWRTATGNAVKNVELIRQIDRAISTRPGPVRFRWVRGHVGNYFNEMADTLAGDAARQAAVSAAVDTGKLPATTEGDAERAIDSQAAGPMGPRAVNSTGLRATNSTVSRTAGKSVAPTPQTLTLF